MLQRIKNIKEEVYRLLRDYPKTRDDDRLMILNVWLRQESQLDNDDYSFKKFAFGFKEGKFADPSSILRAKRKWLERVPAFRGRTYIARKYNEEEIRQNTNTLID